MNLKLVEQDIFKILPSTDSSVVLFGSVARGTPDDASDIDVLDVREQSRRPYRIGRISVSIYTPDFLSMIARQGSLFVLHLLREGIILRDPNSVAAECLKCYSPSASYDGFREKLRDATQLLDVPKDVYLGNWHGFGRLSLFLLRSTVFSVEAERGAPSFCLKSIARRSGDIRLQCAYNFKHSQTPNWQQFLFVRGVVEEYLCCTSRNRFGSIQGLIANSSSEDLVATLALRLLRNEESESYDAIRDRLGLPSLRQAIR